MAKRGSRVYAEEAIFFDDSSYTPIASSSSSSGSSYQSRRSSRSSFREDWFQYASEMEEGLRNGAPIHEAASALRYQSSTGGTRDFTPLEKPGTQLRMPLQRLIAPDANPAAKLSTLLPTIHQAVEYPVAPVDGRPLNFGVVVPGFYRSSYPKQHDFDFIKSLELKTIVTLTNKEEFQDELAAFVNANGIRQVKFDMKGTKKEAIPLDTMAAILQLTLDKRNYPLLIHCNHGKHRTGCVVAAARRVAGWEVDPALDEYRAFASPKIRDCDIEYINAFQSSLIPRFEDEIVSQSPVRVGTFKIATYTHSRNIFEAPGGTTFKICRAVCASGTGDARCSARCPAGRDDDKKVAAAALWQHLTGLMSIGDRGRLFEDVLAFTELTYCGNHRGKKRLTAGLEEWRDELMDWKEEEEEEEELLCVEDDTISSAFSETGAVNLSSLCDISTAESVDTSIFLEQEDFCDEESSLAGSDIWDGDAEHSLALGEDVVPAAATAAPVIAEHDLDGQGPATKRNAVLAAVVAAPSVSEPSTLVADAAVEKDEHALSADCPAGSEPADTAGQVSVSPLRADADDDELSQGGEDSTETIALGNTPPPPAPQPSHCSPAAKPQDPGPVPPPSAPSAKHTQGDDSGPSSVAVQDPPATPRSDVAGPTFDDILPSPPSATSSGADAKQTLGERAGRATRALQEAVGVAMSRPRRVVRKVRSDFRQGYQGGDGASED